MYQLIADPNVVLRLRDRAFIPFDDGNVDYAEYKQWLAAGNTPLPIQEAKDE